MEHFTKLASSQPAPTTDDRSQELAVTLARAADERKGGDILLLQIREVSYLADYFVIVTGFSRTQVKALADAMQKAAEEHCQRSPLHIEGQSEPSWIVLDYGDVIAHIMMPEKREYYSLEAFWGHGTSLPF